MTFVSRLLAGLPDIFGDQARSEQARKRIICDCEHTFYDENGHIKEAVFVFLDQAKKSGYEVVLASNRFVFAQMVIDGLLADKGLKADHFGEVQSKTDLTGTAYIVIDDKPDEGYISCIRPAYIFEPDDERISVLTKQLELKQPINLGVAPRKRA